MKQLQRIGTVCLLSILALVGKAEDITATWDFKDSTVVADIVALSKSTKAGTIKAVEKNGILLTVEPNGKVISKGKNCIETGDSVVFKVPVKSDIDIVTVAGVDTVYAYSIAGTNAKKAVTAYTATEADVKKGYVEIINKGKSLVFISVVQKEKEPQPAKNDTLSKAPFKATFSFKLGTEGQRADFGTASSHFISDKVVLGSNLFIKGADKKLAHTLIEPLVEQNGEDGGSAADESNAIRFLIQPDFGLTFTPTKVTFKTTRYVTDNGLIDISWQNPNKSILPLETGVKPNRDSDAANVTTLSYGLEDATPGEGTSGLVINIYNLPSGKQIGFSDIVIEGTLDGVDVDRPMLDSLTINGKPYSREDLFEDSYEGTLEISKKDKMISKDNPVTVKALVGKVGTITYEGNDKQCKVVIPMNFGENKVSYTLNIIQKTSYSLTYISTDGETVIGKGEREKGDAIEKFDYDEKDVTVDEGFKMRGWYYTPNGEGKYSVNDIITDDIVLYALATEIEEISAYKKYFFDLTDRYFYAEDHEAFNPGGKGFHWDDGEHGWAFKNGNTIGLLVGPKATISITLCQYSQGDSIYVRSEDGDTIASLKACAENDGEIINYRYVGKGGTITLCIHADAEVYIHAIKITNTAEPFYKNYGNWYLVKQGEVRGLINALEEIGINNAGKDSERSYIFLPKGVYDFEDAVRTDISGYNISLIGQSKDSTIIVTTPDISLEGLGSSDLFTNSSQNLYMQDLTLQNDFDYYNAGSDGRATVLYDAGNHTVGKNVKMLSYQDTYYSFNNGMQAYFEDCDIHGVVDFLCGGGDIRLKNSTLSLEPRGPNGSGSRTIVAPRTMTNFGYIFDHCKVVDLANGNGSWNFGRAWTNKPIAVYISTTLDKNAENTLISTRWTEKGLNNMDPYVFGEYNTMDINGNDITPESNAITSYSGIYQTILVADQIALFSYEKMFSKNTDKNKVWDPAALTVQISAPADAKYNNGTISWTAVNGAIAYAIFKNDEFVALTDETTYNLEVNPDLYRLSIRSANAMGGFGPEGHVSGTTGIETIHTDGHEDVIYNLQGTRVKKAGKGVYIINGKKTVIR